MFQNRKIINFDTFLLFWENLPFENPLKSCLNPEVINKGINKGSNKGINKGFSKGINKGISKGINKGINQGINKGINKGINGYDWFFKNIEIPQKVTSLVF